MIEADIAAFVRTTPAAGVARFEVHDCQMDGQVHDGKTIVLSARLARLPHAQRYFIIAHEFAHHRLDHQVETGGRLVGIVSRRGKPGKAVDASELAHRTEFEADAYAVRMMHAEGLDTNEAAKLFDSMGEGTDSATHPAFSRRARAIRDVIATLNNRV
jgi:Zn-dependent protease with chaperone function